MAAGSNGSLVTGATSPSIRFTVSSGTPFTAADVGGLLRIYNAATTTNNGSFTIVAFNSTSSIDVTNILGVAPDFNNPNLGWQTTDFFTLFNLPIPPTLQYIPLAPLFNIGVPYLGVTYMPNYYMRAKIISSGVYIYWVVPGQADSTGAFSGQNPSALTDIVVVGVR